MNVNRHIFLLLVIALAAVTPSCRISYSFTGASIDYNTTKTFSIADFPNRAQLVNPNLSPQLTEALKDKFINQTSLELVNDGGDLEFTGQITGYNVQPMAVTDNEIASKNRLTVTLKVKFVNNKDHEQDFDSSFSAYSEFESTNILSDVEDTLLEEIIEQITEDIFNKSVANW